MVTEAPSTLIPPPTRAAVPANPRPLLTATVLERLRNEIIACKLAPGSRISEASLCARYGVGKAPVRAALARVCQEGLARPIPRQGYVVAPITLADVREMYELRLILEPAAVRLATGRVDIALLRRLNRAPGAAKGEAARLAFIKANRDFHLAIVRATGNARLVAAISQLMDDMARLLHLGLFWSAEGGPAMAEAHAAQAEQHEALLRALAQEDADGAEKAARAHVGGSRELVLRRLDEVGGREGAHGLESP